MWNSIYTKMLKKNKCNFKVSRNNFLLFMIIKSVKIVGNLILYIDTKRKAKARSIIMRKSIVFNCITII